jgi:glycosyltransferase involved in cell wall biosynthesis
MTSSRSSAELPGLFLMTNSFETGGSERQFAALAQSFRASSFRPWIGCIVKQGGFLEGFDEVMEFPLGGNLYGVRSMQTRLRLARYLRESHIAVAHAFDFYTNLVLIPAARLARVPVVIGSQRQLGDLLSPTKSRAQLAVLRWCDRVVCNSNAAASLLMKQGLPERQIVVIGNGLAPSAFAPATPAFDRTSAVLRIGMIARMNTHSKNHKLFLRAAASVLRRFPYTEFILAGDGPLRPELERQARDLQIGDRVRFLGDRRDITAILASLDISVLPSASESLSNAILESMAAGVPVVAARVGGNPELVANDRGILVALGHVEALANAIECLLQNPAMRAEFGRTGRKFAESNFTIAAMRKRHEELYAQLLETKTRRRNPHRSRASEEELPPRPLRVAIVAASSRYVGGQSVQAELLLANWRNDSEVEASLIPIDPSLPRGLKWVESVPVLRTIVRQPFYLATLWRGLSHADIAHIFSASYWSFLIAPAPAWMLARARGKKTMIHYHCGEARDHLRRFRTARPVLAKADRLVVPSGYLVEVFREFGLAAQVVPNIVDLSQFTFRERKPLRPHLVCTRGFHPYYRVDLVVRAFAEVQREFPLAHLDLVGQGPQEAEIRKLVQRFNLTGVNFAGVASRQEIGSFYDAADIFINASALDNMPVSILEAFASGTPVVSTAPEGMRYLVEHERTGLLSEPGDARALAGNVIRLMRDPGLYSRIAFNAHEQSKRYCWTEVREQWLDIYRSLAPRNCGATHGLISVA